MSYIFIHPLFWAWSCAVWSRVKYLIKQRGLAKGTVFGLIRMDTLFGIPGMLMSISSFQISGLMVAKLVVSGLVQDIVGGSGRSHMNQMKTVRMLVYGFLTWLIPFIVSFAFSLTRQASS